MNFELISEYQPTGDQPEAIAQLTEGVLEGVPAQTLLGVTGSGKTFTIANVIKNINKPTLILSHNKTLAAQLYGEFKSFFPNNAVEYYVSYYDYYQPEAYLPSSDTYIEKDLAINEEIDKLRLAATSALLSGRKDVVVVSSVSCIYGMGNPSDFYNNVIEIKKGKLLDRNVFLRRLVDSLYVRNDIELNRGNFRVKGDTVDIYLAYSDNLLRVMFWDDEIDAIEEIDPISGIRLATFDEYKIYPANLFMTTKESQLRAIHQIEDDLTKEVAKFEEEGKMYEAKRLYERVTYDMEMIRELGHCSGIENYSRYFDGRNAGTRPYCLLDFFPDDFLIVIDESHVSVPQIRAMYGGDRARKTNLVEYGFRMESAFDNRPLKFEEFKELAKQVIYVSATPADYELVESEGIIVEQVIRPTGLLDPVIEVRPSLNQIDDLMEEIQQRIEKEERVLVTTLTKRMAEELTEYLEHDPKKPCILCEYCHSMGNGPGDLEDYFQLFQKQDVMCGGFVWEGCDHAIACGTTSDQKTIYHYGGDSGEVIHDGNFCMDGLVYPDRTPHTGLLEYRNVYRPVRVVSFEQETKKLTVRNHLDFTNLKDWVEIRYEVCCDGICLEKGVLPVMEAGPGQSGSIDLKISIPEAGRAYLKLFYYQKETTALVPAGHLLGYEEILLHTKDDRNQTVVKLFEPAKDWDAALQVDRNIVIRGADFTYVYEKRTGLFSQMNYGGKAYLDHPMELNIWRAPADNDMYIKTEWKRAQYDQAFARAYETRILKGETKVEFFCRMSLAAASVQPMMEIGAVWTVDCSGRLGVTMRVHRNTEFPELPRFGLRLFLNRELDQVCYFGMGPYESYIDKHQASLHGQYHTSVLKLQEDYIRPQENGSHCDVSFVELSRENVKLSVAAEKPFSFNASRYTQEELTEKAHNFELVPSGHTVLCIDYTQDGIGSNSCGPGPEKQYQFLEEEFTFAFGIRVEGQA